MQSYYPERGVHVAPRELLQKLANEEEDEKKKHAEKKQRENDQFFLTINENALQEAIRVNFSIVFSEQEKAEKQRLKEEAKQYQAEQADAYREAIQNSSAGSSERNTVFEDLLSRIGAEAFKEQQHEIWRQTTGELAKATVKDLPKPLDKYNNKLEKFFVEHSELRSHMENDWLERVGNIQSALATRASIPEVINIVPQFEGMSTQEATKKFTPTQQLNSMAIPAANTYQHFLELERQLQKHDKSLTLKSVLGQSAVLLGVQYAKDGFQAGGKFQQYQEKLAKYGIDFADTLNIAKAMLENAQSETPRPQK